MAKGNPFGLLSRFLYSVGETVRFCPDTTFAPARSEEKQAEKGSGTLFLASRLRMKNSLAKMCEQSFFLTLLERFFHSFFTTRIRSFGVLFFSCGFLQILSYFLGSYVPFFAGTEENLLFGVSLIFLTLLCSFTRWDVKDTLKKSFLFRAVLAPLFGVETWQLPTGRSRDNSVWMALLGAVLGLFSVLFSPFSVLMVILFLGLTLFIFYLPEAGLVTIGAAFFLLPYSWLFVLTCLTLLSFLFKCAVGKRSLVFSLSDLPVLICLAPFLFFGKREIFLLLFTLISLYILSLGLLRNLLWIRRFLIALTLGGTFCGALICTRFALETAFPAVFLRFPELESLLFVLPETETVSLLVILCPLSIGLFRSLKGSLRHILSFLSFLILVGAVFCSANHSLWIALALSLVIFYLFTYRPSLILLLSAGLTLVSMLNVFPPSLSQRILSFFGFSKEAMAQTAETEGLFASFSGAGAFVFWPLLFVLLGYFVYRCFHFSAVATRPEPFPQVLGGLSAVVSFVAIGFQPVAVDERSIVIFVLLLALPRAALRCAKREEIRLPY